MRFFIVATTLLWAGSAFCGGNTTVNSYPQAKEHLREIWGNEGRTIYCDCRYTGKEIDRSDCSFNPPSRDDRADNLEWEHIVPAHAFGKSFPEWYAGHPDCRKNGKVFRGRKCAERTSLEFRRILSDLYNLAPSVGEVNNLRANYDMGEIEGEERRFGACDFEVGNGTVEPRPQARGDIARAYLYMDQAYPERNLVSEGQRRMFQEWDRQDPVTSEECERYRRIRMIQENENPILKEACAGIARK